MYCLLSGVYGTDERYRLWCMGQTKGIVCGVLDRRRYRLWCIGQTKYRLWCIGQTKYRLLGIGQTKVSSVVYWTDEGIVCCVWTDEGSSDVYAQTKASSVELLFVSFDVFSSW